MVQCVHLTFSVSIQIIHKFSVFIFYDAYTFYKRGITGIAVVQSPFITNSLTPINQVKAVLALKKSKP